MPRTLKTVTGFFTAGGAGTNIVTVSPGAVGNYTVDAFNSGKCYLESVWVSGATTDFVRVRSGRLHDPNQGIRLQAGSIKQANLLPWPSNQQLISTDNLTVEIDATGAGSGGIALTYGFDEFTGANQGLANWADVSSRIVNIMGQEVDVAASATIGSVGAGVALNAFADNWKVDSSYALLGFTCSTAVLALLLNGPNTGGQDIGFPGDTDTRETRDYFVRMANMTGRPCIPIIEGGNKGSTVLKAVDSAAGTAPKVSLILAQLG